MKHVDVSARGAGHKLDEPSGVAIVKFDIDAHLDLVTFDGESDILCTGLLPSPQ